MKSWSKRTNPAQQSVKRPLASAPRRAQPSPAVLRAQPAKPQLTKAPLSPTLRSSKPEQKARVVTKAGAHLVQAKRVLQARTSTFKSAVVQAVKIYPNLHPGAIEPVNQGSIFRLNSFAGQYRLHRTHSHGVNVPNQQYNFVRTREGETLLHNRYRHPSIAEGKQVLYAGEVFFNNGQLQWWSNGSGHYQPNADDAAQANLPMDQFFSYQQIIKGEHMRKKR